MRILQAGFTPWYIAYGIIGSATIGVVYSSTQYNLLGILGFAYTALVGLFYVYQEDRSRNIVSQLLFIGRLLDEHEEE